MASAAAWRRGVGVILFGLAFTCALAVVFGHLGQEVNPFDESMLYLRAALMERGERVNVDFHSVYPFLNYQLTSWAFAFFGETALAGRLVGVTFLLGTLAA